MYVYRMIRLFECCLVGSGRKRRTCPGSGPRSCGTWRLSRVWGTSLCGSWRRRLGLRRMGSHGFTTRQSACSTAQRYFLLTTPRLGRETDESLARFVYQIVKYPTRDEVASEQGVGPHFDAGFLTFVSPPLLDCFGACFSFSPSAHHNLHTYRFCWATRQFHFSSILTIVILLTLCTCICSYYRHRIIPAYRSKIWLGNGSTCRHVRTPSSLISGKVRPSVVATGSWQGEVHVI